MAHGLILQGWTSIAGAAGYVQTQSECNWLDLDPYEDFVPFVEIAAILNAVISLETSPTRDPAFFQLLRTAGGVPFQYTLGGLASLARANFGDGNPGPKRLLRWTATHATLAWSATFRICLSAHQSAGAIKGAARSNRDG